MHPVGGADYSWALAYFQEPTHSYPEPGRGTGREAPAPAQVGHALSYLGQKLALFQAARHAPRSQHLPVSVPHSISPRCPTQTLRRRGLWWGRGFTWKRDPATSCFSSWASRQSCQ